MPKDSNFFIQYKKNSKARIRLFCFHHAGGGASFYYPWLDQLSIHIELITVLLPGRENRFTEPLNSNLNDIITQLNQEFYIYKDKPFFIFGHSLGALISFKLIQSIQKHYAILPQHMIVSASKAPDLPYRRKNLSKLDNIALKEELKIYDGIDQQVLQQPDLLDLFLPIIRSDFSIIENYIHSKSTIFPFDITALSGTDDKTVNNGEIVGWSKYTTGKFEHIVFPGGHFYLKNNKKVLEIINQIGERNI